VADQSVIETIPTHENIIVHNWRSSCLSQLAALGIIGLIVWVPIRGLLTSGLNILPAFTRQFSDAILVFLLLLLLLLFLFRGFVFTRTLIDIPLLLFVSIGLISWGLNGGSLFVALLGIYRQIAFTILFYTFVNFKFRNRFLIHLLFYTVIATGLVQMVSTLVEFYLVRETGDLIPGTLGPGQANGLGYMLAFFILWMIGLLRFGIHYTSGKKLLLYICLEILLIPFILCMSRFSYLALVPVLIWLFRDALPHQWLGRIVFKGKIPKILFIAPILIMALAVFVFVILSMGLIKFVDISPTYLWEAQLTVGSGSGRLLYYPKAWDIVSNAVPWGIGIGVGPGNFSSFTGQQFPSRWYLDLINVFLVRNQQLGFDSNVDSSFIAVGGEFGLIGLIIYLVILYQLYRIFSLAYKRQGGFWKSVAWAGKGMVIFYVMAGGAMNTWEVQYVSMYIWLFAGVTYWKLLDLKQKNNQEPSDAFLSLKN